jgi:putative transcriptional regulator
MELKLQETLAALMKERRLSQRELSRMTGVPVATINEWTARRRPRDPIQLAKVASTLGVSIYYLLFGQDEPTTTNSLQGSLRALEGTYEVTIRPLKREEVV